MAGGPEAAYRSGPLRGLTPNVVRLGLVSLLADISTEMLYPLVPVFLTTVLGAPVAFVGLIEGLAEATASLLKTFSGRLSDRTGRRRPFLLAGYSLSAAAKPLLALASGWPLVLVSRVIDRFGKGLRGSPRDALLADSVERGYLGRAFGWHRALDTAGAVVGPLLALGLVWATAGNLRLIFALSALPGAIGAALVLLVRERRSRPADPKTLSLRWGLLPGPFRGYLVGWGAFALTNSSDAFLILKARQLGFGVALVVVVYAFYNFVYGAASPVLGTLSDRLGRQRLLVGGLAVFALVYAGLAAATQPWQLWLLFAAYGLYQAATDGLGKAFAVDLVPAHLRASAVGLLGTVSGLAALAASGLAGLLWSEVGPWAAFAYGAAGAATGCLLIARLRVPPRQ